ncbi:MAG TPA: hypothetical protein VII47_01780 [Actinomycetota bacterium]|jgi:hypothetical protein
MAVREVEIGTGIGAEPQVLRQPAPRPVLRLVAPPAGRPGMAFVVLAALAVGAIVLGLVVLNVLVAQKSFRLGDLNRAVQQEQMRSQQLRFAVATAGSPDAIAAAAQRLGLVPPDRQEFLVRPAGREGDGR